MCKDASSFRLTPDGINRCRELYEGANLGEMVKIGIPVPPGFVIATSAFENLLQTYNLNNKIKDIIAHTDIQNMPELLAASSKIMEIILSTQMIFHKVTLFILLFTNAAFDCSQFLYSFRRNNLLYNRILADLVDIHIDYYYD